MTKLAKVLAVPSGSVFYLGHMGLGIARLEERGNMWTVSCLQSLLQTSELKNCEINRRTTAALA